MLKLTHNPKRKESHIMAKYNKDSIIMTVDEVAEYLKLSKITVYKLTQKGEIPGFRIGSSWRYNRDKIDEIARVGTKQNT